MKPFPLLTAAFFVLASSMVAKEPPPQQALADIDPVIERALKTYQVDW